MAPAPPPFGSQEYWNKRFTDNPKPFEWLEAPDALDPYIVDALNKSKDPNPQLLHIGCGTSLLSYHLRAHVEKPQQIHNLDYSDVAIKLGRGLEVEIFRSEVVASDQSLETFNHSSDGTRVKSSQAAIESVKEERPAGDPESSLMRWSSADLLNHTSILQACTAFTNHASNHPVGIEEDFGNKLSLDENLDDIPKKIADNGFPVPSTLWTLVGKFNIEPQATPETVNGNGTTHRPKVLHWIYVLERTNVPLFIRP
ncbi:uncharacterized protein N0V89_004993 [Didymosphaeria variabile]|uniref:Methyltransferase domain-containing protein n=1 Tax=Didymosphaeria variabile TaxID=1932322 RepID=A0A9W8XK85_9PLEO|nr:uncharacterized protein N0V89_004993 [Didymosphaeria variabile]KAJ4353266.1 hypothetical protein N0V89_004993 [Didymosphaeria variabile]